MTHRSYLRALSKAGRGSTRIGADQGSFAARCPFDRRNSPAAYQPNPPSNRRKTHSQQPNETTRQGAEFAFFTNHFFSQQPAADIGRQGGLLGSDGLFNNNDFVVFIDQFFAGC